MKYFYQAMTAWELEFARKIPEQMAYMACHFSPYGTRLGNVPKALPEGAVLMVNDRIPVAGHDGRAISEQLGELVEAFQVAAVVLDLQRPGVQETKEIAGRIVEALPCPVAVSDCYAEGLSGAVFLSPPELWTPVEDWLAPWAGREIWAEAVCQQAVVRITEDGSCYSEVPFGDEDWKLQEERFLSWEVTKGDGVLSVGLRRGPEELKKWMEQAEKLGVKRFFGLYQQSSCGIDN